MDSTFLFAFFSTIILIVLFVVAVTVGTISSVLGSVADDLNEDK
ncbi:MAG: hypothetical protein ACLU85_08095 [Lachnospirales bacterium]|jgi:hypothetical protein